eukprot:jgi/Psemu1/13496/gm1.13496_g
MTESESSTSTSTSTPTTQEELPETKPANRSVTADVVEAPSRDYSKLRKAAASQSLDTLKAAISAGNWTASDIDENDAYGKSKGRQRQHSSKSALHMAAWKGCLDNVKYLVETVGCDVDAYSKQEFSYGKTAIFFALTQNRIDVTEYLLERGAKVTIVNNKGQSVLSMAASHFDCLEPKTASGDGNNNNNNNIDININININNNNNNDNNSEGENGSAATRVVQKIQAMEIEQRDWWNFRASHSDGFEYGDLDPRFFADRPLRETDPTDPERGISETKPGSGTPPLQSQLRKKKNKSSTKRGEAKRKKKPHESFLSEAEQDELNRAWDAMAESKSKTSSSSSSKDATATTPRSPAAERKSVVLLLLSIVQLSDQQRLPWIPEATEKLMNRFGTETAIELVERTTRDPGATDRQQKLLEKILAKLRGEGEREGEAPRPSTTRRRRAMSAETDLDPGFASEPRWRMAREVVKNLQLSSFELPGSFVLALPNPPIFVHTPGRLASLLDRMETCRLVAIDTEWYTKTDDDDDNGGGGGDDDDECHSNSVNEESETAPNKEHGHSKKHRKEAIALSTLQLSFLRDENASVEAYVVDLKKATTPIKNTATETNTDAKTDTSTNARANDDYRALCQRLVRRLLLTGFEEGKEERITVTTTRAPSMLVLGFSIRHDLHHLEAFLEPNNNNGGGGYSVPSGPSRYEYNHVLDLQRVLASAASASSDRNRKSGGVPGLKTCASRYSSRPLSKDCQCSDWGNRPLSEAQLEYAGLDAAILLGLLAERSREEERTHARTCSTPCCVEH